MKTNIEIPRDLKKRAMKKVIRFPSKECTDHTGATYPSIKEMCARWSIQPETYTRRVKVYHMSVEAALTTPVKPNGGQSSAAIIREHASGAALLCVNTGISTGSSLNTGYLTAGVWRMPLPDRAVAHPQPPPNSEMLRRFVT